VGDDDLRLAVHRDLPVVRLHELATALHAMTRWSTSNAPSTRGASVSPRRRHTMTWPAHSVAERLVIR